MRVQTQISYTTIPKKALLDTSLSLRAKGFYACMMSGIDVEDENAFNELLENGYIELKKNEYVLLINPIKHKDSGVVESDNPFIQEPSKKLKKKKCFVYWRSIELEKVFKVLSSIISVPY